MKPGFDGSPPEFRQARGSEVRDPTTGAIIREGELSPQNIRIDRIEWLHAHRKIDDAQKLAGRRLQKDTETAQIGGYTTIDGGKGGSGTNRLSDVKCDAIDRVNCAREHVGNAGWRILELVVIENVSLAKAESRMRLAAGNGMGMLLGALDALARHYKLC